MTVGDVAIGDEDHEEWRCREIRGGAFGSKGGERARPIINEAGTAQLDFDEAESPITEMDDGIAFKAALVAVVADGAVKGIGIGAQVADGEIFKKEPEGGEVAKKVGGLAEQLMKKFVPKSLVSFPSWVKTWLPMSHRKATGAL